MIANSLLWGIPREVETELWWGPSELRVITQWQQPRQQWAPEFPACASGTHLPTQSLSTTVTGKHLWVKESIFQTQASAHCLLAGLSYLSLGWQVQMSLRSLLGKGNVWLSLLSSIH